MSAKDLLLVNLRQLIRYALKNSTATKTEIRNMLKEILGSGDDGASD